MAKVQEPMDDLELWIGRLAKRVRGKGTTTVLTVLLLLPLTSRR